MDSKLDILWRVFLIVMAGAGAAYILYAALWLASRPVFAFTGHQFAWRPPRRVQGLLKSYLYLGPVVLANLAVVSLLFLTQYLVIHDVFRAAANPLPQLREMAPSAARDVGSEAYRRVRDRVRDDPEAAARTAARNVTDFVESGCFRWVDWLSRRLYDLYHLIDVIVLGVLIAILLRDLATTSWLVALLLVRLREIGTAPGRRTREILARVAGIFLFTLAVGAFFTACAVFVRALSALVLWAAAGLARTFSVEVLVAAVSGPVPPVAAFLLLAGFYLFLLEIALLFALSTATFAIAAGRSLRLRAGRLSARLFHVEPPEGDPSMLKALAYWGGSAILKVAAATIALWLLLRWGVFPLLGFRAGAATAFLLQAGAFNALLAWWRVDRDLRSLLEEVGRSLRIPRPA